MSISYPNPRKKNCQANLTSLLSWAADKIKSIEPDSAQLDAEILLALVLKQDRSYLYTRPQRRLTALQTQKFRRLVRRRADGQPIAYLTGHKEFYGLNFIINPSVLIPRPETELLVDEILKYKTIRHLADIGTGSGIIAISLAKSNPRLKIYASDISPAALAVARRNAARHHLKSRITFKLGNLVQPFKNIRLDALVANLPYLDSRFVFDKFNISQKNSLKFEPLLAFDGGSHGLESYQQLLVQLSRLVSPPDYLFLEIDHLQKKYLPQLIHTYLPLAKISFKKDLAGLNRICVVKLKPK